MLGGTRALLFDMDGTLLDVEMDAFLAEYVKTISTAVVTRVGPRGMAEQLLRASACMMSDSDPETTNVEVFAREFYPSLGATEDELQTALSDFYENEYRSLSRLVKPVPGAREVVEAARARGYLLALATNPVFPRRAIWQRLEWSGIDPGLFDYLTSYEDMHACKPHGHYYLELASKLGCRPDECLMVGNDVDDDLPAGSVGMRTYLVSERQINRGNIEPPCDFTGSLDQLRSAIESMCDEIESGWISV